MKAMSVEKHYLRLLLLLICILPLYACDQQKSESSAFDLSATADIPKSTALVDTTWLKDRLTDPSVKIIAFAESRAGYLGGHIPGAQFLDWSTDIIDPSRPDFYAILPQNQYEALLSRLSISPDSEVVLYDDLNSRAAVRFFWTMKYYGHEKVRVLDGGKSRWIAQGLETSTEVLESEPTEYRVSTVHPELLVDTATVKKVLRNDEYMLVDGRPFVQYTGATPGKVFHTGTAHERRGHIWGAQSVPWADNFNEDGTFKSPVELMGLYGVHHIVPGKKVISYCNEGLHAAVPWFVLSQLLGFAEVSLYDDSMADWANQKDTPMKTGKRCM